jgi:hypothetical protein
MIFSDAEYNVNAIFRYNNNFYALIETQGSNIAAVLKNVEGNIVYQSEFSSGGDVKFLVEQELTAILTNNFSVSNPFIAEILQNVPLPPPSDLEPTWQIIGRIVDDNESTPIQANLDFSLAQIIENTTDGISLAGEEGNPIGTTNLLAAVILTTTCSFDGTFNLSYTEAPKEGTFDFINSSVTITAADYMPFVVSKITKPPGLVKSENPDGGETQIKVYDLGTIRLKLLIPKKQIEEVKAEVEETINKFEATKAQTQAFIDLPFESKASLLFDIFKERIKRTIFTYLINLLSEFGAKTLAEIQEGLTPTPEACPDKDKLKRIIEKRNKIVNELNNLYNIIKKIDKALSFANGIILGLKTGLAIATALPTPPFAPSGAVATGIDKIQDTLVKAGVGVTILTVSVAVVGNLLGTVLDLLSKLDLLIEDCAPESGLSFEEINDELNQLSNSTIQDLENSNSDIPVTYKGFTFEIKFDKLNQTPYPKRFAQALNIQNIPVLKGNPSFASDPQILIDELKFIIDTQNLRAD